MSLTLQLVNEQTLPDGGPVSIHVSGKRGIDIGRAAHLDWTLPDPRCYISGKHCEIRYVDGGYWLHDVSTNGTFLNGAGHRMHEPHRLRTGDRFIVGHYIVAATVEGETDAASAPAAAPQSAPAVTDQDWWVSDCQLPPPIDPKDLQPARNKAPVNPDFLDWAADVTDAFNAGFSRSPSSPSPLNAPAPVVSNMDWAVGPPSHVAMPPPVAPPIPTPRRPDWDAEPAAKECWRETTPRFAPDAAWETRQSEALADTKPRGAAPRPAQPVPHPSVISALGGGRNSFAPLSVASAGDNASFDGFIRQIAKAAGVPPELLTQKNPADLAQQVGGLVRLVVENLMQLLNARQQAKQLAHTAVHTIVQATDNNPLKFCPSAQDALRIMFGPANAGYLDADRAMVQGFEDLKDHHIKTFAAMQRALTMIMVDLNPKRIDRETEGKGGVLPQIRKARLWDAYEARWEAKVGRKGGEPVEAFMRYFAEFYDSKN